MIVSKITIVLLTMGITIEIMCKVNGELVPTTTIATHGGSSGNSTYSGKDVVVSTIKAYMLRTSYNYLTKQNTFNPTTSALVKYGSGDIMSSISTTKHPPFLKNTRLSPDSPSTVVVTGRLLLFYSSNASNFSTSISTAPIHQSATFTVTQTPQTPTTSNGRISVLSFFLLPISTLVYASWR